MGVEGAEVGLVGLELLSERFGTFHRAFRSSPWEGSRGLGAMRRVRALLCVPALQPCSADAGRLRPAMAFVIGLGFYHSKTPGHKVLEWRARARPRLPALVARPAGRGELPRSFFLVPYDQAGQLWGRLAFRGTPSRAR